MASETLFLQSAGLTSNPNFVRATGFTLFSNYSQSHSGLLTDALAETLVKGGVASASADTAAIADFQSDPNFSVLFAESVGNGTDGAFSGSAKSETKVVANFVVDANQSFSFDFSAELELTAKEIENTNAEYNKAKSKTAFLVLDTTDLSKPKILDYFGIRGKLISSEQNADFNIDGRHNFNITSHEQNIDIDIGGNNGMDSVISKVTGTYQRTFNRNINISIVEVNVSSVSFVGDNLIGNLGQDVIYGTIKNDRRNGTKGADKIYGSFGNDKLYGYKGDDILEGGQDNDTLSGGEGNDQLYGGWGDDILIGGRGNNILAGGAGYDQFIFKDNEGLLKGEYNIIQDFQVDTDKLVFQNWSNINPEQWLNEMYSQGNIIDTNDGVLFKFNNQRNEGTLLLSGLSYNQINPQLIVFS